MLKIKDLYVDNQKSILKGLSLDVNKGETHIIMGTNGAGKSTLVQTLAGYPNYEIVNGSIEYGSENLAQLDMTQRALEGLYLAPQYPPSITGLAHASFIKEAINAQKKHRKENPLTSVEVLKLIKSKLPTFLFDDSYISRSLNDGFSGGERKRNEMLQISLLEPNLVLLDEIDSGLDLSMMQTIANFINSFKNENRAFIIVTHYPQFAKLIQANYIHILKDGKSILSTNEVNQTLANIEEHGFKHFN
jgi:Fe-S cluster assembly ATP-binding protein